MMRKYYFLLSALLLQCFSFGAFAQTSSALVQGLGEPLITDASQLSSNASDRDEGTDLSVLIDGSVSTFWHSDWHGDVKDLHYLQVELMNSVQDGYIVMYMQRRDHSNTDGHLKKATLSASEDGETWEDLAVWELGNAEAKGEVLSDPCPISKPYLYFRVTNSADNPIYFHAAEFELYNPSNTELILNVLNKILSKYDVYYYGGYDVLNVGTEFGQYADTETADKILDALEKADIWAADPAASEDFPSSIEEANAYGDKVDSLFTAFWKSEVLYKLPTDGYYRIIANLPYKQEVETGEVDEENNPITETTYVKKAIFCSTEYKGMWGTLKEDMANYVWKLTENPDSTIDMLNVGMDARFTIVSGNAKLDPAGSEMMAFDYAGTNEDGKTVVYIRSAKSARGSEAYIHQWYHEKGTQVDDKPLTTWKGTFDMGTPYESDKGTSEWYLEPVSEEEVAELIEAFEPVKNHDKLVAANAALRTTVAEAIETAKDRTRVPLVTSADQMTSPFSQNDLGNPDGGNLGDGVLIDGDPATFWHSAWSAGTVETGSHYIQLSGMEGMTGDTKIYVMRRATADSHPTEFTLKGSNDPEAEDSLWTTITVQTLGNVYSGGEFTTPTFDAGETPYSYVRVYASKNGFWHSAELQIYRMEDNPNSQFAALGELATNLEALYDANVATEDADITYEMYTALMEAYEAFQAGIVDPTELRNIIAKYIGYTKGMVEGSNPGQWSDLTAYETFNNLYKEISDYNDAGHYTKAKIDYYKAAIQLAADNYMSSANKPKTDTWYRIKFAPEELYDATGWTKNNVIDVAGSAVATPVFDNYITIAEFNKIEGSDQYDYYPAPEEDIREGVTFCALDEALLEERPEAAMFRFVELDHSLPVVDDLKRLKDRSQLALEMSATVSVGDALITSASQLSSNASDEQEGKYMESLLDNDIVTFWHSDWHGRVNTTPHYLQVSFDTPVSGAIKVKVSRRSDSNNGGEITRMYITGSNDGETWENVGYVELPFGRTGETVTSNPVYVTGEYTNLRFIMTAKNGDDTEYDPFGNVGKFFHLSEFQIYPVTMTYKSETAKALQAALAESNKVVFKDLTVADISALAEAYNTLQAEINAGEHKVAPVSPAKVTRFALQNRATGLFVNAKAKNNADVTMELMPSFVEHAAVGYGENVLRVDNFDGTYCSYLHIQKTNHQLVTWNDKSVGSNSGLMIEEVESSNGQTDFAFTKDIQYGEIKAWCYPVDIITSETEGKVYSVAGIYTGDDQTVYLALDETDKVKAGQPVLYINGIPEDYVEGTEEAPAKKDALIFTVSTTFNFEEGAENGLIGTLKSTKVNSGVCTFEKNLIKAVENEAGATVAANTAYLDFDACAKVDGEHALNIVLDDPTGIQNTLENVSKSGNIYSADGKLVRANGTLNDMKGLGKGIYILNGVKVLVK